MSKSEDIRIYVASLKDYNEGKLIGKWLDLADYSDGEDVMEAITDFLADVTKKAKDGEVREEYAIHDAEGIPSAFYHESMGESEFDFLISIQKGAEERYLPLKVVVEYLTEYHSHVEKMDARDIEDALSDGFVCKGDRFKDAIMGYVEELGGIGAFDKWVYMDCIDITDTDKRILLGDEEDAIRERLEDSGLYEGDKKGLEDAVEEELEVIEKALKRDPVEWYLGLGLYKDEEALAQAILDGDETTFYLDEDRIAKNLELSGDFVEYNADHESYIFRTS